MQKFNFDKFYEITAICNYNSERRALLQPVIKKFLLNPISDFNIDKEIAQYDIDKIENQLSENLFIEDLFKNHDYIITSGLDIKIIVDYTTLRYGVYGDAFFKKYAIPLDVFLELSKTLWILLNLRIRSNHFFDCHQFASKEDYANLDFYSIPNKKYIEIWKDISTIDLDDFLVAVEPIKDDYVDVFLKLYSFDIDKIKNEPNLRFREYPIFYHDRKIIIIDTQALLRYLPHKMDILLKKCKSYRSNKGDIFETIALNLVEEIPNSNLVRNIKYDGYELDGLLNLKHSTWFVECKSRNISSESLIGNSKKIQKDIEKSIRDGIKQGVRAINYKNSKDFEKCKIKKRVGIIVVVEGIFPNLRLEKMLPNNPIDQCKYPVCVFNYFDLRTILNQEDSIVFEEFIIWRSQKNMPIYAFDECDYWDFFTKMKKEREMKKGFSRAQKNENVLIYIGDRFNEKRYISNLNTD